MMSKPDSQDNGIVADGQSNDKLGLFAYKFVHLAKTNLRSPEFYQNNLVSLRSLVVLVLGNVLLFHFNKLVLNCLIAALFVVSFCYFNVRNEATRSEMTEYLKKRRALAKRPAKTFSQVKAELASRPGARQEALSCFSTSKVSGQAPSSTATAASPAGTANQRIAKPSLTGSYRIDDELHQLIELLLRDYCDYWYRENISNREEFIQSLRIALFNAIRYASSCLKTIDWEHFFMNIVAHNLVIQMRLLKKAREKRNTLNSSGMSPQAFNLLTGGTTGSGHSSTIKIPKSTLVSAAHTAAHTNESMLIEVFFDLEADLEKNMCRDDITFNSSEKEHEFVQELSEIICYSLLSTRSFECSPLRYLLREILANYLIKYSIDNLSDPDYINQTLLYLCQDQSVSTQNFLTSITTTDSLDELTEIGHQIDEEILKTRSYDKGGQNDQEIKLRLSSLQYVKRNIDHSISSLLQSVASVHLLNQTTGGSGSASSSGSSIANSTFKSGLAAFNLFSNGDEELKLFQQQLANIDFEIVLKNEIIQHCFIEYMGKQNVQNLISFYLNADMFRQFAKKELTKIGLKSAELTAQTPSPSQIEDTKMALKDFAKGLINSYLLSAVNFTATSRDDDDQPINISNRVYYKAELAQAIERLEDSSRVNETLLDDLQAKIYLLMKQKYYPDFKSYPEFHKLLLKNDLIYKISSPIPSSSTSGVSSTLTSTPSWPAPATLGESLDSDMCSPPFFSNTADPFIGNASDDSSSILSMEEAQMAADRLSQSSFDLCTTTPSTVNSSHVVKLSAVIISVGRCNDLKSTYAIYIIDVTKVNETLNKSESWQTYRRFNDFYDLHMTIKKRFPVLSNFILPGKSFRNSLSDEFLEKRRIELNRYLQTLCNPEVVSNNPTMLDLMLKFLENKRWENSQTNFKRRVDSILTPMISSVQNIQTSILNAPDNVMGIVSKISDNLLPNNVVESLSKQLNATSPTAQQANTSFVANSSLPPPGLSNPMTSSFSSLASANSLQSPPNGVLALGSAAMTSSSSQTKLSGSDTIDAKTILNAEELHSNNLPIRVILMLVDEVFDLKEKNQWLRQSLMAIVKSFMKNFKGDSMNKKIKEQIADYLSEEQIARYLKNFRKRMWPKGILADWPPERTKNVKEITKIMAKTKMLALVSDDLRHILGSDTTKRGVFDLFDLFQHQALNKRIIYILMENLLINFFEPASSNSGLTASISFNNQLLLNQTSMTGSVNSNVQSQLIPNPFNYLIRLHLSRSSRVKNEFKLRPKQGTDSASSTFSSPTLAKKSLTTKSDQANKSPVKPGQKDHRKMPSNVSISSSSSSSSILSLNAASNSSLPKQLTTNNNNNNSKTVNFNVDPSSLLIDDSDTAEGKKNSSMTRSKSLHNEIQC